mmetsp:Transcript_146985/g.259813  ORF Transcript_146985/g.259813 Transcript_146985/m.259813 type:complete len:207 (-) Transcript_146985:669-1289(-)
MNSDRIDRSKVAKDSTKSWCCASSHKPLSCRKLSTPCVTIIPKTKKSIARTIITHINDLSEPIIDQIIIRSSRKKRMTRITRRTFTTRIMRKTRSKVISLATLLLSAKMRLITISKRPAPTINTSNRHHQKSSVRKKSKQPSATHRNPSSTVKAKVNKVERVSKKRLVVFSLIWFMALSLACSDDHWTCQPMLTAFKAMSTALPIS